MKLAVAMIFVALLAVSGCSQKLTCLPPDIKEDSVVSLRTITSPNGKQTSKRITVGEKLAELKAKCICGKLVDSKRTEIRFYELHGCWGNPPEDYLEIMDQQRKDLASLKKKYTVIEMTCNPSDVPIP